MSSRDTKILEAAGGLFARYGVSKTTMNDIAGEAGLARQTLYNAYPNKDEVLRAVVKHSIGQTLIEVKTAWVSESELEVKLRFFNEVAPLKWYDMVQSSPEVSELFDGLHRIAKDELAQAADQWRTMFTELFAAHAPDLPNASEIAEFYYSSAVNAKYAAENRTVLETRLRMLIASVMALVAAS